MSQHLEGGHLEGGAGAGGLLLGAAAGGLLGNNLSSALTGAAIGYVVDKKAHGEKLFGGDERGCTRQFTKKYMERGSPPYPANNCGGQTRMGNDGNMWHSKKAANGVHRWVPLSKSAKKSAKKSVKKSAPKKKAKKAKKSVKRK